MDELTAPLGQSRAPRRLPSVMRVVVLGLGVLSLAGFALWFVAFKGLLRDSQTVAAPTQQQIQVQAPVAAPRAEADLTGSIRNSPEGDGRRTVTIIDGMNGKRQEVVIGAPEPAPAAVSRQSR
jgi:hypothetical protein